MSCTDNKLHAAGQPGKMLVVLAVLALLFSCSKKMPPVPTGPGPSGWTDTHTPTRTITGTPPSATITRTATYNATPEIDAYEGDGTPAEARWITGSAPAHSIYPAGDADWVKFIVPPPGAYVTVSTSGMPGGDTEIFLYGSSDTTTPLSSNDDRVPGTDQYSEITTALVQGTYFVKVSSPGAGIVCGYGINISFVVFTPTVTPTHTVTQTPTNMPSWLPLGQPGFTPAVLSGYKYMMAFDGGTPYVMYTTTYPDAVTVMKYTGGAWIAAAPAGYANAGSAGSFIVRGQVPYVCFMDTDDSLSVRKYNGIYWETVGPRCFTPPVVMECVLYDDGQDLYVCYRYDTGHISVRKFDGANWNLVGPESIVSYQVIYPITMAVRAGVPYISFTGGNSCGMKPVVMKYDGSNWSNVGTPCFSDSYADYGQMAFDNGELYFAYEDSGGIYIKKFSGTDWMDFDSAGFPNDYGCSGMDSLYFKIFNGIKYVFYRNGCGGNIYAFTRSGTAWVQMNNAGLENGPAFYISDNGIPMALYYDSSLGGLGTVLYYGY